MIGPPKPVQGAPCNGCGLCCVAETCPIALAVVPNTTEFEPCPALEWEGGRSWCGLIRNPKKYAEPWAVAAAGVLYGFKASGFAAWVASAIGDGICDSGPSSPEDDDDLGLTAADWIARYA